MTRSGRRVLRYLLLAAFLIGGSAVVYLRTSRAAEDVCTLARRHLPKLLGLDVRIGSCALDPLTQTVRFRGVSLFEPGGETPLVAADEVEVTVGALNPFFGSVKLDRIRVAHPRVTLDLTRPRPDAPGGCRVDGLSRLDIGRLEIRDADVRIALPDGRAVEVSGGDVTWRTRKSWAEIHLTAATGRVVPRPGAELELSGLSFDARFHPDDERLEITRADLGLGGMSLEGSGELHGLCDPEVALEATAFVPLSALARAIDLQQNVAGHVWARVAVEGQLADPAISADVAASDLSIGRYAPGGFDARLSLRGRELRIDSFETSAGSGLIRARGTLGLTPRLPLTLDLETDRAEFGPVLAKAGLSGSWVDFPATGRVRLAGNLLPSPALEGDANLKVGRFELLNHPYDVPQPAGKTVLEFDAAEVGASVQVLADRVELTGMRVRGKNSLLTADATLHYAPERGLVIRGQAEHLDFSELGHIAGLHWAGHGSAQFTVLGPYGDPRIDAAVNFRDFDFWRFSLGVMQGRLAYRKRILSFPAANGQKGRTQYHGSGELRFGRKDVHAKASLRIPGGRTEDLVDALMPMHENVEIFDGVLEGDVSGTLEVNSPVEAFEGTVALDLANTRYYGRRLGDGRAVLRFVDGEAMILQKTVLRGALGVTEAEGTWHFDGPLNYRFRVSRGSLAELVGPARARKLDMSGDLTLSGKVGGDTTMTTVTAYLTSPAITFAGKNLGATHLEARVQGRDVQVWGKPFEGARTTLRLKIKEPYPWEVIAHLSLPEIQPLLPKGAISKGVSGAISGTFDAQGNLRDMNAMEGVGTIDRLTLTRGDFSGANEGKIGLAWRNGALRMDQFRFRGPNTELSIAGSAGPSRLDLDVHGTFDMRLLESFVPQLERAGGKVEVTVAARGTPEAPSLAGAAALQDGRLSIRDQPLTVRGLSGRLEFSETRLLVQDVHGALNDGRLALDGDIRLERFSPKFVQIRMQVDRVTVRPMEELVVVTDGELHLAGRPEALTLSGDLDLAELLYRRPLSLEALLTNIRTARVSAVAADGPRKDWLAFDVAAHARGNVRVDNNLAKGRLRGDLRLTGTNTRPGLLGTIEAQEGSQIFFRGNTFSVSQALIEFKDRREIDPVFDLHAQTSARQYVVNLHAFGRARDPQVILTSDPDLPEGDILSLLTIGITSRDKNDTMSAAGAVAGEAIFNATGLDKQVQRFLPRNPILRDLSFHISSTYNESSGTVVPTAQLESKFLTEKLKLGMSQPMGSGRGTRASAEYRFDDRLSTQFQWDNERNEELPNFGVDLKLRWEMD